MTMGEEKKIEVDEVDAVDTPPRARVTPEFERKRDYLAGFLAEKKPETDPNAPGGQLQEAVIEALKSIYDPEIPVDIYELGLIYEIIVDSEKRALINMTLTSPACPSAQQIPQEVRYKVKAVPGITEAWVEIVWEPPWSKDRMSEVAKLTLGMF